MFAIKPEVIYSHGIFNNDNARESLREIIYNTLTTEHDTSKQTNCILSFLEHNSPYRKFFVQVYSKYTKNYVEKNTYLNEALFEYEKTRVSIVDLSTCVIPYKKTRFDYTFST